MAGETCFDTCRRKLNGLLTRISSLTGYSLNRPTYICLKMTAKCNSRCVHCNIWKQEEGEAELSPAQWIGFLDNLRRWVGKAHVVMTGGEALLADDMLLILRHACNLGLRVELLSNGLLLDRDLATEVVNLGVEQVTVSLDGAVPATHDRFRGGDGFFHRTIAALAYLGEARNAAGRNTLILLKTVISSYNVGELTELAAFAKSRQFHIRYQPIEQNYGEPEDCLWYSRSPLWIRDIDLLCRKVEELKQLRREGLPIENTLDDFDVIVDYFKFPDKLMMTVQGHETRTSRYCSYAMTNFVVSSNGDVRMCFKMEPIGNIAAEAPQTIWRNRKQCWSALCQYR